MQDNAKKGISRRDLIKTAAAGAGVLAIGLGAKNSIAATPPQKWDKETDVIVIGYGAAGAATAIAAHDAGARVIILDKAPVLGGATRFSGGIIYAAGTEIQKAQGIDDSAEEMIKYFRASNMELMDPDILATMANDSADIIKWLTGLGLKDYELQIAGAEETPEFAAVTPPKKRGHCLKGLGKQMMVLLNQAVIARKITVNLNTEVKELVSNPARNILGVYAQSGSRKIYIKAKKGIVICAGGYNFNKALVRSFAALFSDGVPVGDPNSNGSGMIIGAAEGSALTCFGGPELAVGLPGLMYGPGKARHIRALFLYANPAVFVDSKGKRFANESSYYAHLTPKVAGQKKSFFIFDEDVYKRTDWPNYVVGSSPGLKNELESGAIKKADNIRDLARIMGVDAGTLENTLNTYNANAAAKKDPEFGKTKALAPVKTPPFYAGYLSATMLHCYGGLKINPKAQVIDVFGKVIPRLYAAGAVTGTVYTYPGSGTLLNTCFVFGRIAGKNAASEKI